MYCKHCGTDNPDGSITCYVCGEPLQQSASTSSYYDSPTGGPASGSFPAPSYASPAKSSNNLIGIMIGILALVLVAGAAVYFFVMKGNPKGLNGTYTFYQWKKTGTESPILPKSNLEVVAGKKFSMDFIVKGDTYTLDAMDFVGIKETGELKHDGDNYYIVEKGGEIPIEYNKKDDIVMISAGGSDMYFKKK